MTTNIGIIIAVVIIIICIIYLVFDHRGNLNKIKGNKTGNGQYGTADWATEKELRNTLNIVKYEPIAWRMGDNLPKIEGTVLGVKHTRKALYAYVDSSDTHTLAVTASGGGKTTSLLYPNIEYNAALGCSFFCTDTKGGIFKDFIPILKEKYSYYCPVFDLRYPNKSNCYNLMGLVNKYMDLFMENKKLSDKAKSEAYAKNIGRTIIHSEGMKSYGQNQFFYDTAEAVISAVTLLTAEFCPHSQRHIVSVFKLIRQLMEVDPSTINKKNPAATKLYLQQLYSMLPETHICKDLLAPAATSEFKTMASIIDTALSKLLSFIDSEIEQMICFDSEIDIEEFAKGRHAVFLVIDEKMGTRNFMVSLIYRQFYGELIQTADMIKGNRLQKRVNFFMDEVGTHNPIEGLDEVFSAARSRNIICMPLVQTTAQLTDKYGREKAKVIEANCQNLLFSFLSPLADDANRFEKVLGNRTIQSGSVSHRAGNSRASSSTTYSMMKRPLMFPDEMTSDLEKGDWVLKHTGMKPAKMKLLKHEDWGITFNLEYEIESKADRPVKYASRAELMTEIQKKYPTRFYPTSSNKSSPIMSQSSKNEQLQIDPEYFS